MEVDVTENRFLLTLDFKQKTIRSINFVQNNVGSSVLELSIVDGGQVTDPTTGLLTGGNAVDITDQVVSIAFLKPDNTLVIQDITTGVSILGDPLLGKVQCILMSNTLAAAGVVKAEVSFSKDGNKLSTTQFNFTVSSSLDNGAGVLSSDVIPVIDAQIAAWQTEFDVAESGRVAEFEIIKAEYNIAIAENTNLENIAARTSAVKAKTFANLDARLEESEQDLVSYKADTTNQLPDFFGTSKVRYVGHRGASQFAPENTLPSYELAGKMGYWGAECDVLPTSDGVMVLMHDDTVDRTTNGTGNVWEMTLAQIKALTVDATNNIAKYPNLKVPTLEEYLVVCKKWGIIPFIEFKKVILMRDYDLIIDTIKKAGLEDRVVVISVSFELLQYLRTKNKRITLQLIKYPTLENIEACVALGNCGIDCLYTEVTKIAVDLAHSYGVHVNTWTVNTLSDKKNALSSGVDIITSDIFVS